MVAQLVIAVAEDNERGLIGRPNIEDRLAAQMDLMEEIAHERAAIAAQQEAADSQGTDEVDGVHPLQQPLSHPLADITGSTLNITSATTSRLNVQEVSSGFRPFVVVDSSGPIVENGEDGVDEAGEVEIIDEQIAGRVEAPRAPQARPAPPPPSPSPAVSASSPLPGISQVSLAFSSVRVFPNPSFTG